MTKLQQVASYSLYTYGACKRDKKEYLVSYYDKAGKKKALQTAQESRLYYQVERELAVGRNNTDITQRVG